MKSAVFYGKHDLRIEDYPMPKAGAHDIVIQVKSMWCLRNRCAYI